MSAGNLFILRPMGDYSCWIASLPSFYGHDFLIAPRASFLPREHLNLLDEGTASVWSSIIRMQNDASGAGLLTDTDNKLCKQIHHDQLKTTQFKLFYPPKAGHQHISRGNTYALLLLLLLLLNSSPNTIQPQTVRTSER